MVLALAAAWMPLQAGDAEAKRIRIRSNSHHDSHARPDKDRADGRDQHLSVRLRGGASGEPQRDPAAPGAPLDRAAAAAERARLRLEAEQAPKAALGASAPVVLENAPRASNASAVCIAGC
jgi:hypothetical protein